MISRELRDRVGDAAQRAAAAAPTIRPGDPVALEMQDLFPDLPQQLAQRHADHNTPDAA